MSRSQVFLPCSWSGTWWLALFLHMHTHAHTHRAHAHTELTVDVTTSRLTQPLVLTSALTRFSSLISLLLLCCLCPRGRELCNHFCRGSFSSDDDLGVSSHLSNPRHEVRALTHHILLPSTALRPPRSSLALHLTAQLPRACLLWLHLVVRAPSR